jgi:ElaB/YqjD/DUF883 family membrane-anchored ribosome-binding protein
MTTSILNGTKTAGTKLAGNLKSIINDGEELLKAAADVTDEGFKAARSQYEQKLALARTAIDDADQYVHGNAWSAIGVALAAGAVIGFLIAKR